jgi:dolichyl-phosphate-mannose-protein mannosyltransferase
MARLVLPARAEATAYWTVIALLLAAGPLLSMTALRGKSATFDEPLNLVHGLNALETGEWTAPVDYGPLTRIAAAAAVRLSGAELKGVSRMPAWSLGLQPYVLQRVLYLENDADDLLWRARLGLLPVHLILATTIFLFARRIWGPTEALMALLLTAFLPAFLAHAGLVTNDLAVTAALFGLWFTVLLMTEEITTVRVLTAGVVLGLAMLSKYSALFAIPVLAGVAVVEAVGAPHARVRPWRRPVEVTGPMKYVAVGAALAVVLLTASGVVWGFHGFRFHPWRTAAEREARQAAVLAVREESRLEGPAAEALLALAERARVLPEAYLLGMRWTMKHMEERLSFFLGRRRLRGDPLYFPMVFLLKAPLPLVILALLAGYALARGRLGVAAKHLPVLLGFPISYAVYAVVSDINLGERYLLPAYPFLMVVAARVAAQGLFAASRAPRYVVAGLLAWHVAGTLKVHPHHLTFFNEIAGGPRGGLRYLGDSNLDWGQDLKGLGPWMRAHGVPRVKLAYFGTALPEYYGFDFDRLPSIGFLNARPATLDIAAGDVVAVSATCLQGIYFEDPTIYRFLDAVRPIDAIGNTIYVYRLSSPVRKGVAATKEP